MSEYVPPTFCTATVEIEINGDVQDLSCSQRYGHLEDHSAKVWWSDDAEPLRPETGVTG